MDDVSQFLNEKLTSRDYEKLAALKNPKLHRFVAQAIELANPDSVFICTDWPEDHAYIRRRAIEMGEEKSLAMEGHTAHFDGFYDQGRDPPNTKYLLPPDIDLGKRIRSVDKAAGTKEILDLLKNSMKGRQMLVCFFCLGPRNSDFSIPCVQITDSPYVAHSETILYRPGYEHFASIADSPNFFRFLHSEGELENNVSRNIEKRRIYIDLQENIVYSVNTQYGGNTIGLKKLALRLAINKASKEGWLAEHMFLMGVHGPADRVTYFTGAFPSACGKTSTAMIPGQTIVGDDIAYLRKKNRQIHCVNVEQGIFGIIRDVNPTDDPIIYEAITNPGEVIFGNVLVTDDLKAHWLGMGCELPREGTNYSGQWHAGKKGPDGKEITPSHRNARYTVRIADLRNRDPMLDEPQGVLVGGILYGGRDSDTWVPIEQAFDWTEGIIAKGASLESETTAATIGKEGVRVFDLMSNLAFVSIPLGQYIQNNLDFAKEVDNPPLIFAVNYFLRDKEGKYINDMADKIIWILWAEHRVHGELDAIETPTGLIPRYEDLAKLFKDRLAKNFTRDDYIQQFTIRIQQLLEKLDRLDEIYNSQVFDTPQIVFDVFARHRERLKAAADKYGRYIEPFDLEED